VIQAKLVAGAAKLESSCRDEIQKFCSTVTPGEGRVVLCIEAHEDKLSSKCLFVMHEAANRLKLTADIVKEATNACRGELGKLCGSVQVGQGRVMQCMIENKASVTKACADSLGKLSDLSTK
jgi:Golgi apparatus protein 1